MKTQIDNGDKLPKAFVEKLVKPYASLPATIERDGKVLYAA
jgi:hypothetical protein